MINPEKYTMNGILPVSSMLASELNICMKNVGNASTNTQKVNVYKSATSAENRIPFLTLSTLPAP